jgi:predicted lipoprotein with Yx(FWY)xxD motif
MKTIAFGFAVLLAGTAISYAADAWKEAEVNGAKVYTDANGMTLYTFVKDKKAGDATGEGVGGVWHIAKAD